MKFINVYALRWGDHDPDTTLFLGTYRNETFAKQVGNAYCEFRGGKYTSLVTSDNLDYAQFIPEEKINKILNLNR